MLIPREKLSPGDAAALTAAVALEMNAGRADPGDSRWHGPRTFRHDNPGYARDPGTPSGAAGLAGNGRAYVADGLTRFTNAAVTEPTSRAAAALDARHPPLRDGHTIFPTRVFDAELRDRVLISGINNAKIGKRVTKGPWAGFPIFLLTLEERATCPPQCAVWAECYGNGMPMAVRFRHTPALLTRLATELAALQTRHPAGFVVRLHALGDFPDMDYLIQWSRWTRLFPALRVWGYSAHPAGLAIGDILQRLNRLWPTRWSIRASVAPDAPRAPNQVATIWEKPASLTRTVDDTLVCPQEIGRTRTCGTCGLCWNPAMADTRILFLGHGRRPGRPRSLPALQMSDTRNNA